MPQFVTKRIILTEDSGAGVSGTYRASITIPAKAMLVRTIVITPVAWSDSDSNLLIAIGFFPNLTTGPIFSDSAAPFTAGYFATIDAGGYAYDVNPRSLYIGTHNGNNDGNTGVTIVAITYLVDDPNHEVLPQRI